MSAKIRRFVVLALSVLAGACASLEPVDLPDEYTAAPTDAPLWQSLDEIRTDNWQVLLDSGPAALDWRLLMIDSATESLDLQTFLWKFDTTGSMILSHLMAAARRGVTVRLLVDDTFLASQEQMLLALEEHPNIEYRVFNPFKRRADSLVTRQLLNLAEFHRLDHRMHNKALVADNRVAIVGGRNLADEYFGLHEQTNFRDMELLVGGPIVQDIAASFDDYWNDEWSFPIEMLSHLSPSYAALDNAATVKEPDLRIHNEPTADLLQRRWQALVRGALPGTPTLYVDDPPVGKPQDTPPIELANALIEMFDNAEEEVLILSAYLIPTPRLEGAVARAVARGVNVRILTNSIRSNNHLAAHSSYRNHINEMLGDGAQLHEVRIDARDRYVHMFPPVEGKSIALHAKAIVFDRDKVFIGSANLDPRSLRINTEMGLLVVSEELNAAVRTAFDPDFAERNAWRLQFDADGKVVWISDDTVLRSQPAASWMQRIEDWFFAHLPIEDKM
ncbi:MAG: phospholipase D family protein [Chromatiales bacterium]|nr:phospholipase D family protein [Chromatiales bacterium]MDH4014271.1 phospholipase D family protein [Chromatiales bacterium]